MFFFFDESGTFTPSLQPSAFSASVVVGLALSESVEATFRQEYGSFVRTLSTDELADGEPKGGRLLDKSRVLFCKLLDKYRKTGLLLAPVMVDMSIVPRNPGSLTRKGLADLFRGLVADVPNGEDKNRVLAVAQRVEELSEVQLQRIHTWALAIQCTIREAIYWLSSGRNQYHWETLSFEIDPVDIRTEGLEQVMFRRLVTTLISAYSRQHPFVVNPEIHDSEHPVIRRFVVDEGLDFVRMLDGNIHFPDSKTSIGIQVSDIAANIIFRAARSPHNEDGALEIYAHLMDSCTYPYERGPGLQYVSSDQRDVLAVRAKYDHLFTALSKRRTR